MLVKTKKIDITSITGLRYKTDCELHCRRKANIIHYWIEVYCFNEYESCFELMKCPALNNYVDTMSETAEQEKETIINCFDSGMNYIDFSNGRGFTSVLATVKVGGAA